jgi:hypothetical protein
MENIMSKGLGRVARNIVEAFEGEPNKAFSTRELCWLSYERRDDPLRKERVATMRAVKAVQAHRPDLMLDSVADCGNGSLFERIFFRADRALAREAAKIGSRRAYGLRRPPPRRRPMSLAR